MRPRADADHGSIYGGLPYDMFEMFFLERHLDGSLTDLETWRARTLLMNLDLAGAKKLLRGLGKLRGAGGGPKAAAAKACEIAKFVPGTHHYVLGKKFDTLEQATEHAARKGYVVSRVFEVDGSGRNATALREVLRQRGDDE